MVNHPYLAKARILVVDADARMARVLSTMLEGMGFKNSRYVSSGKKALDILQHEPIDMLVTEWSMPGMDGIPLVKTLRRSDDSPSRMTPSIMLTARAETKNVIEARDAGITEFMVKPYSSKALFMRIERIVDSPRNFIFAPGFVGPDRRHHVPLAPGESNRRHTNPMIITEPCTLRPDDAPRVLLADFSFKRKLGIAGKLSSVITREALDEAQKTLDGLQDESLDWIREDLAMLDSHCAALSAAPDPARVEHLEVTLLCIRSRAGMFGYHVASEIAYSLYCFVHNHYKPGNAQHNMVLLTHAKALKVLIAQNIQGQGDAIAQALLHELKQMIKKYAPG